MVKIKLVYIYGSYRKIKTSISLYILKARGKNYRKDFTLALITLRRHNTPRQHNTHILSIKLHTINIQPLIRGYHTAVFILARISSQSIDNCPRHSRVQLTTEGLI